MNAVDTNVLFYAHDPRDLGKQATAQKLIQSLDDGVLLWQVACEFLAASRKLEPLGFDRAQAWQVIRDLRQVWATMLPTWAVLDRADWLLQQHHLSFWDAMIVAACAVGDVARLYTEDFGGEPHIAGVEIVNPFATEQA